MKPEITQKDKLVSSLKTNHKVLPKAETIPWQPSGLAKLASVSVKNRHPNPLAILGLALSMGISSFPTNSPETTAIATESTSPTVQANPQRNIVEPTPADSYVRQLRNDVSIMRTRHEQKSPQLIAQIEPGRSYPAFASRTDTNGLSSVSEGSIPISVPAPKTTTFKPVATASPYGSPHETEGELYHPQDRDTAKPVQTNISFLWPAAGKLSSRYGRRWGRMHKGIDIAAPIGTPIYAAADGVAIAAGWSSGGYGNLVEIRHIDGTTTRYGHNSRLNVTVGQTIRQGQQIAEMGSTGRSTGSHLHFEIRPGGSAAVNPIALLPSNG